jgi:hypothetical protein
MTRYRRLVHVHDDLRMMKRIIVNPNCINIAFWEAWLDGVRSDTEVRKTAAHRRACVRCHNNYRFYKAKKEGRTPPADSTECIPHRVFALWRAHRISNAAMEAQTAAHRNICSSCQGEYEFYKAGRT